VGLSPSAPLPWSNLARRTSPIASRNPHLFNEKDWQSEEAGVEAGAEEKGSLLLILPPSASSAVFKIGPASQYAPLQQQKQPHDTRSNVLLNDQLEGFGFDAPRELEREREV
jgi:hypothetical protein